MQSDRRGQDVVRTVQCRRSRGVRPIACRQFGSTGTAELRIPRQMQAGTSGFVLDGNAQASGSILVRNDSLGRGEARMTQELYAGVHVAEFPAQSWLRLRQDLKNQPIVILDGRAPQEAVCSMNHHAARCGSVLGMTRLEAESLAGMRLLPRSAASEGAARAVLLECISSFSPRIEDASQRTNCSMVLDISGTTRLFGPSHQLGERLRSTLLEAGFRASIAIGANFDTVRLKAASMRGIAVIPEGQEAEAIADLSVAELGLEQEILETFALWGIRTLGELAALPESDLVSRLGQDCCRWQQLARGKAEHTFQPIEPEMRLEELCEFETPVEQIDSLLFVAGRMIDCLLSRAEAHALALASLSLEMRLDGGRFHEGAVRPALPTRDRKFLLKLLQLEFAKNPPPAGVTALTLGAEARPSSKIQLGLFAPSVPEPSRLDVTLARLKALVGQDRVGSPVLEDSHRPDSFYMDDFVPGDGRTVHEDRQPRTALRRLRPPLLVRVTIRAKRPTTLHDGRMQYGIAAAYGPWKTAGCWWALDPWDTEEWDILAHRSDGMAVACLLVHDCRTNEWQLEALYD